jgi:guanylate kinase
MAENAKGTVDLRKEALVLIVSAPSGGGKTTMINRILEKDAAMKRSVSCTTRAVRPGEKEGTDYIFITEEEFKKKIKNGEFLEWEENFGHYYGTEIEQVKGIVNRGYDVFLSIDVKGARNVKKLLPESVSVFIMPPSVEELKARLRNRNTEGLKELDLRISEAKKELAAADEYDYLIMNKELEAAVKELRDIIKNERDNRKIKNKK